MMGDDDAMRLERKLAGPEIGLGLSGGGMGLSGSGAREIVLPSYMGQVVTRSAGSNNATSSVTSYNKPTAHIVCQSGLTSVEVSYASIYVVANQPPDITPSGHGVETAGSSLLGTVTIEQPLNTVIGTGSLEVPAGGMEKVAISLSAAPAVGSMVWIRYNITTVGSGGKIPYMSASSGDNAWAAVGEAINALYPCKVEGITTKPTGTIYGNSRNAGNADVPDALGNVGETARAWGAAGLAYRNVSVPTDEIYWFVRNCAWRRSLAGTATHVFFNGDINGIRAVRGNWSAAQCFSDVANTCKRFPGKTLVFGTSAPAPIIGPGPSFTVAPDANLAQGLLLDADIRAKPSPIAYVVDSAELFDPNGDGLWENQSYQSGDQVHESPAGYAAHAAIIPASSIAALPSVAQPWSRWSLLPTANNTGTMLDANDPTCFGRFNVADDTTPVFWAGKCNFGAYDKPAGSTRPVLVPNVIGTRSALRFTAASSQELISSGSPRRVINGASGFLLLGLIIPGSAAGSTRYWYYLSTESDSMLNRLGGALTTNNQARGIVRRSNGTPSITITGATVLDPATPYIIAFWGDLVTANIVNISVNGRVDAASVGAGTAGPISSSDGSSSMIGSSDSIAGSFFDGYVFNAEVYPSIFTLDQVQRAEADLAWENGLQSILDATHPYRAARPT